MTNYLLSAAALALLASACSAAEKPAAAPAKPAAAAVTAASAPAPSPAATLPRYVQSPAGSSLGIVFEQAGASNNGSFKKFVTELQYEEKNLAASNLKVTVQIASIDTLDGERNGMVVDTDLLNAKQFPTAQYVANSLAARAGGGVEAVGKLTLRGVTHDLRLPLTLRATAGGLELSGEARIKRLDYGVGQGEWKATDSVGDEVKLQYKVLLVKAP